MGMIRGNYYLRKIQRFHMSHIGIWFCLRCCVVESFKTFLPDFQPIRLHSAQYFEITCSNHVTTVLNVNLLQVHINYRVTNSLYNNLVFRPICENYDFHVNFILLNKFRNIKAYKMIVHFSSSETWLNFLADWVSEL